MLRATTASAFSTSQLPKVVRTCGVFSVLTSTRALRRNRVHFLNSSTSKSAPTLLCFYHFHFHTCFKPQRCALVQHPNIQKCSGAAVFRHFDFEMCFAPQPRTFFQQLNFQKCPENVFFYGLTSKCASRQTGVHFFDISTSKSVPGLRWCFVPHWCAVFHLASAQMAPHAPLQRAYFSTLWEPQNSGKHSVLRLFYFFAQPASSFFWASFSPLSFFLRPFSSLTLPSPAFPSVQTVGSLTSKLPSMKWMWHGTSMAQSETKPMWCQTVHRNCDPGRRLECWGATIGDTPQVVDAPSLIGYVSLSYMLHHTSSTAQGCGGSFKNRKPIGEIGCCESGMAERIHWWTERCLRSPLFLSFSLTIYLPTSLSSMYLSIYLSLSLFHLITYLPIYLCTYLPIYLSIYLSLSFICLSV